MTAEQGSPATPEPAPVPALEQALEQALDRQLAHIYTAPELPAGFHARLRAAVARSADVDLGALRARLEAEHRQQTAALEREFVQLRWSTLGSLIGAAFVTGIGAALALPWIQAHYARFAPYVTPGAAVAFLLGTALWVWAKRGGGQSLPD